MSSQKAKRVSALRHSEVLLVYRLLGALQAPFGFVFWLIEQRKARLLDRIGNDK
jgi:hypothetical protein